MNKKNAVKHCSMSQDVIGYWLTLYVPLNTKQVISDTLFPANLLTSTKKTKSKLECGPMPNMMAALPNIGGAFCSTPQTLADACCWSVVQ